MMFMRRSAMKKLIPFVGAALLSFLVLSAMNVVIFRGLRDRNGLVGRNDCERTFTVLFTSLRRYDDFGSAIEATRDLKDKILGLGLYDEGGSPLLHWGAVPDSYAPPVFDNAEVTGDMASMYVENSKNDSLILLLHPSKDRPPPPPRNNGNGRRLTSPHIFDVLNRTDTIYFEIRQPQYWRQTRIQAVLFPVVEIAMAALVSFISFTVMKNREYRRRIAEQKNLVILGTAASTLAHEIKNPLLAIRLQTSIISKALPGKAQRELEIIDSEVERLSALSHRVNDFLRDPLGQPSLIDAAKAVSEVGQRLCGRPLVHGRPKPGVLVKMDAERLRSTLENLLRNALESGGKQEEVGIEIAKGDGGIRIDILDRGGGIPREEKARVFDPFFTTKSRGTGIGLAICRRFVQAAGGAVSLEDRPGGGTIARVILPEAGGTKR
jgi:two-component system sensor histidine kinase HydH